MFAGKVLSSLATAGLCASLLVVAPAQAGTRWSGPQEISSRLGLGLDLSDSGRVAAWIRTKVVRRDPDRSGGPVRTSWYRSARKGWTASAQIPGTGRSSWVRLSADGNYALIEPWDNDGYLMARRQKKNTWGTAQTVVNGTRLGAGQMSADAQTIVWVAWSPSSRYEDYVPGTVMSKTRQSDGTWTAPLTVGQVHGELEYDVASGSVEPIVLSGDGSTLVWIDETFAVKAVTKAKDGSWSAPALIKQYAQDPCLFSTMKLSFNGSRLIWNQWIKKGILTTSRVRGVWAPVEYLTRDEADKIALSPNGKVVAFGNFDKQFVLRTWNGARWTKPIVLGPADSPSIAITKRSVAWTYASNEGSTLRSSVYTRGKWQRATKIASSARSPELNKNGRVLAYGATGAKKTYSVKR